MQLNKSINIWKKNKRLIIPTNNFIKPVLKRGSGTYVWDIDGNKYLDLNCGQFCLCFGHNYKPLNQAIVSQLKKIVHTNTNTLTDVTFKALKKIIDITDQSFGSGILLSTGAEAVEFALRFAKSISKNEKIIYFNQGYHGLSLGSQSVSTSGKWAIPKVFGTYGIQAPSNIEEIDNSLNEFKKIIAENKGKIAAVIMEPILGAGGMIFPPKQFFKEIKNLCVKHNIILIFDECQTGFGRTGAWFCYQNYGVSPDILVFAKAGGAGLPVSGALFTKDLAEKVDQGSQTHFSSHQNDPLAAAVMMFVIKEIESKNLLTRVSKLGKILLDEIIKISQASSVLVNPRGIGLMVAFDLNEKLFKDQYNPGLDLVDSLLARGIIIQCLGRGRTFRVMPNFFVTSDEIDFFIKNLEAALSEIKYE